MTLKEAYETGRDLDVYVDSEMADQDSHSFDDLWQSIYDIVQVAVGGIVEEDPEELKKPLIGLRKHRIKQKNG